MIEDQVNPYHAPYRGDFKPPLEGVVMTSLTDLNEFAYAVRKHWSVENQLHWCLDVVFREDDARARKDNSPLNMNVLRKAALSLLKSTNWGRIGLKKKMFIAALNPNKLLNVLFGEK